MSSELVSRHAAEQLVETLQARIKELEGPLAWQKVGWLKLNQLSIGPRSATSTGPKRPAIWHGN